MRVLGIDLAWKMSKNPSGIALVEGDVKNGWACTRIAPSIDLFCLSEKRTCQEIFQEKPSGTLVKQGCVLKHILDTIGQVDCIVVDSPLVSKATTGRREADNAISKRFWSAYCSTHSARDYVYCLGQILLSQAEKQGYIFNKNIIETYPHPAILSLMNLQERLMYKVGKIYKYWKDIPSDTRRRNLISNMKGLKQALKCKGNITLPEDFDICETTQIKELKKYEDALDALVCAWVGICFLTNRAKVEGFGNAETCVIWIPQK